MSFTSGVFDTVPFVFVVSRDRLAMSCVWPAPLVTLMVPAPIALRVVELWSPLSFCETIGVTPPEPATEPGPTALPVLGPTPTPALIPLLFAE